MPGLIVRVSPWLTVKSVIVHPLPPSHSPPIAMHDGPSEMVPPVACASGIVNPVRVIIVTAKIER